MSHATDQRELKCPNCHTSFAELERFIAERDRYREALRIAEVELHAWSVLNTRTDPRESQRMGRRALDRVRAVVGGDPE